MKDSYLLCRADDLGIILVDYANVSSGESDAKKSPNKNEKPTKIENEWDFFTEKQQGDGAFDTLITKSEQIGASGYELLMTVGVIGLVFSIIFTSISLLMTSNAQKKEEKKSHALIICIAGIIIFSVFSIIGFFKSIGSGL